MKIKLTLILLSFYFIGFSQTQITGKIINQSTGKKIVGVNITINNLKTEISDSLGNFVFKNLIPGKYKLQITSLGYFSDNKIVTISENQILNIEIKLQTEEYLTDEIVITATKSENYVKDIPSRVNVVTSKQITAIPSQTVDDFLKFVPGVIINKTFGIYSTKSSVTMRGMSGSEQARTLVMIDGIPVNKSDGGSVNWNLLNSDVIEKIEITKGAGSSLYGGNAMGGVINIITKQPQKKLEGKASFEAGTYNTFSGKLNISAKPSDKFYINLNSFYRKSEGYVTQSETDILMNPYITKSNVNEYSFGTKLGYNITKNQTIEFDGIYYNDARETGEKVFQPHGNVTDHDTYHLRANYKATFNKTKILLNVFYLSETYKKVNEYVKDDYVFYDVSSLRNDYGTFLQVNQPLFSNQILTAGIDLKQGSVDADDIYYTSSDIVHNQGKMNFYSTFIQEEIELLNKKIKLIGGLRFDYANYFDGEFTIKDPSAETNFMLKYTDNNLSEYEWTAVSPKFSAQFRPNNKIRTFVTFAKGFRPPILDDLCRSGRVKGGFKIANQKLKPEYLNNFEFGIDLDLIRNLQFSGTAFYSIGNDFMYYVSTGNVIDMGFGDRPITIKENIGKIEIYGVETEIKYQVTNGLNLFASYTFSHSTIKEYKPTNVNDTINLTNNYLTDVPNNIISLGTFWKNKIINASLLFNYMDKMWVNDLNIYDEIVKSSKYPDYYTIDLKLSKDFFKYYFFSISIQNILDKKFYDSKGAVCPGRFITAEIGIKF